MTGARGRRSAAAILVSACALLASPRAAPGEEPRLVASVRGLTFEGGEVELASEMRRSLADQEVTLTVTVDSEVADRFNARGPRVRHRFAHPLLTAGSHELVVRTGTERATVTVRVLPSWIRWAGGTALLVALLLVALEVLRRWRRAGARPRR